jgi:murein DD-endopeptidase MepM/ murein hydrolase activator NlpD
MSERVRKHIWQRFEIGMTAFLVLSLLGFGRLPALASEEHPGFIEVVLYPSVGGDADTAAETDEFGEVISALERQARNKRDSIEQLKKQMEAYQRAIEQKRAEGATLANDLSLLENRIAKTELDIRAAELEIDATNLEISDLQSQIGEKTLKILRQREMIAEFIRELHKTDKRTAIDLFLTEKTLSDFFNDVQFLQESQRELKLAIDTAKALKADLETREAAEKAKKEHLVNIQNELTKSKSEIDEQKTAKAMLAEDVRVSEVRYRYELAQLKREVDNINNDIVEIERKLRKTLDQERLRKLSGGTGGWGWPVDPGRGITTYFHDPDYPFRHVFEHPGLDIRASQGTAVRAVKGGYVARAKDAGKGYSYVMLVHDGDVSTVYGHVSRLVAQEDTYVEKGDIIAYSGGMPGTPGAGPLTTGPHLHFEFRLNGIPIDPLNYLKL